MKTGVRLRDNTKVYVVDPDMQTKKTTQVTSPRLLDRKKVADFKIEISEDNKNASIPLRDYNGETISSNNLASRVEEKTDGRRSAMVSSGRNAVNRSGSQSPATAVYSRIQTAHPAGSGGMSGLRRDRRIATTGRAVFIESDQLASATGMR